MKKSIKLSKKQTIIGGIVVISIFAGGFTIVKKVQGNKQSEAVMQATPEIYTVPGKEKIFVNGKIVPAKKEDFSVDGEKGILDTIKVEDGQNVEQGQQLFICKNETVISEIEDLKEQIKVKENEKNNLNNLEEEQKKSIDLEIGQMNNKIKSLESKAYQTVYAPFSGKIYINEKTQNGEQSPSLTTLETNEFYIKGQASEQDLSKINIDQEVDILVYSTQEKFKGKVTSIGERPSTDQNEGNMSGNQNMSYYDIKISFLENQDLSKVKNGFHVQSTIEASNNKIKVPYTALIQEDEKKFVYKVIDGIVYKQEVKAEEVTDEFATIVEGVGENDEVIRYSDDKGIKEGQNIYEGQGVASEGEVK
ncbi:efflux RND transporter periplasmic adaptor subunit [Paraclostridium sordellii]|uniref:efflux RND transporter periplasmic adaptor subunit n=1 Tax=Paraclostridium sordellii TaxID=1505 RepID=UPI0005DC0D99|nr:efflux RND transporter periplasmic adaptor subunit [Paeniclostridium sordellii]CEN92799.1 ABC transporter permease [[Clostridium] sordellii] [Paeniclostridium sordellii]CEN96326.1 ABC transporter permease [[Clostridium] sordellii] [Paeniclostridium sordellii]